MADKRSEVEAKFDASNVGVTDFIKYVANVSESGFAHLEKYKQVGGDDTYYQQGENFLRHRYDGQRRLSIFTVKQRKSTESISDRHEIDLPLALDVDPDTAAAFLKMTGWKPVFTIHKMSYIAHMSVHQQFNAIRGGYVACLALYDVCDANQPEHDMGWERYLEVEIEKESEITHENALIELKLWVKKLQAAFSLGEPMNKSLFEIYGPKPKLLPEATIAKVAEQDKTLAQIMKETVEQKEQVSRCVP